MGDAARAGNSQRNTSIAIRNGFFMPVRPGSNFYAYGRSYEPFMRGRNWSLEIKRDISSQLMIGLTCGRASAFDDTLGYANQGGVASTSDNAAFRLTGLLLGMDVEYYFDTAHTVRPFLIAGAGADFWKVRRVVDNESHRATDLNFKVGTGIQIPVSHSLAIDIRCKYTLELMNVADRLPETFYGNSNWSELKSRPFRGYVEPSLGLTLMLGSGGGDGCKSDRLAQSAHETFETAKCRYDKRKYLKAIESLQQVIYNYPGDPVVDTAQYFLALSYFGNKDYALASVEFNRLVLNYPGSVYADHSQFMRAVCTFETTPKNAGLDQADLAEAIRQLEDFILEHPESELVPDADKYLNLARTREAKRFFSAAVVYTRIGASEAAKKYYQKVIDDYTSSEYAPAASYNIAEEEMNMRAYDEARRRFENFVVVYPNDPLVSKARKRAADAAFKAGEAALKKADYETANGKFQTFKKDFPTDSRVKKADQYLQEIAGKATSAAPKADAKS